MALGVILTAMATGLGLRPGWSFYLCLWVPPLAAAGREVVRRSRREGLPSIPRPGASLVVVIGAALMLATAGAALAVRSAWLTDVAAVSEILARLPGGQG
jgi:hypothetical protein